MKRSWMVAAIAAWIVAIAGGMGLLLRYKSLPAQLGQSPSDWPARSRIPAPAGRPTLVMLAHPKCPCTQASVTELAGLMQDVGPSLQAAGPCLLRPAGRRTQGI
jgi:hypothetical protein